MKKEKNNFTRAMIWLREHGKIKDQKDLANRIGVTETTITRIKNGHVHRPDEDTLCKFNKVFGDIINVAYLRGESDVMLISDMKPSPTPPSLSSVSCSASASAPVPGAIPADAPTRSLSPSGLDPLAAALLASKDETIAVLRAQLANTIADKDETIAAMKSQIDTKDTLISNLQQQLIALRTQAAIEKGVLTPGTSPSAPADHSRSSKVL